MAPEITTGTNGKGKPEGIKLEPDLDMAVGFLKLLRPDGPWVLTAIKQYEGRKADITTRTFTKLEEARTFIAAHNVDRNVYYNPNPTKTAVWKKPEDAEMAHADFVHCDLDALDGESPEQAKLRYLSNIKSYEQNPTFIIDS